MSPKNKNIANNNAIKSIVIILLYFMVPYLIGFVSNTLAVNVIMYALLAILLILCYKDTFIKDFKDLKKNNKKYIKSILLNVLLVFVVMTLTSLVIGLVFNIRETTENDYSLRNMFSKSPLVLMFLTCIYYPVVEGIVFRKSVRDIIDKRFAFVMFSSLFYFFFNIVYTSMNFNNIMASLCYFFSMLIVSNMYFRNNNFTSSIIVMSIYNFIIFLISLT